MRLLSVIILCVLTRQLLAQNNGFPFGHVTLRDVSTSSNPADTAAHAIVLNEFGEAYFDDLGEHNLVFTYHAVIKILKNEGLSLADYALNLYRGERSREFLRTAKATSYNMENGSMKGTVLDPKSIHTVRVNERWDQAKFAIPNVRVGTVIEVYYEIESPFIWNFRNWQFQTDIPKVKSEYWATIPGNYVYNITLRGFIPLTKNENEVVRDCFTPGGGDRADCARYKWAIQNVPAFVEEEYMTAKSNFISMINFELSEVIYFDGRRNKFTKEWKDAEQELRTSDQFGVQLKRGKSIVDGHIDVLLANETDPLIRAQKTYSFIQNWYQWDGIFGIYSELGIKKAFDARKGNVGDINLSLVAALRYAGIDADPMVLSTRANGVPIDVHPVLSDFNYVIAKVNIGDKEYLLDATDDFLPFGTIPEHCLNGKGRVFGEKASYWSDIKTTVRARKRSLLNLKLDNDGIIKGSIEQVYLGYDAIDERKEIFTAGSTDAYFSKWKSDYKAVEFTGYKVDNPDDLSKPVTVRLEFALTCFDDPETKNFLFNPFLFDRITRNPFRSTERQYPVDYASALERTLVMAFEYPPDFQLSELPNKVGIVLPNGSAKYAYEVKNEGNKVTVQSFLTIGKPVFSATEYHYLKELYSQIVSNQQTDMLFKKKS